MASQLADSQVHRNSIATVSTKQTLKGSRVKVFKRFTIDAAHRLPDRPELHGHTYKVEVGFEGPVVDGYVIREADLTALAEQVRNKLDHKYLNDVIPHPTSENIAKFIWDEFAATRKIAKVVVYRESCEMGVEYTGESNQLSAASFREASHLIRKSRDF